jgi:hypothetical protein
LPGCRLWLSGPAVTTGIFSQSGHAEIADWAISRSGLLQRLRTIPWLSRMDRPN